MRPLSTKCVSVDFEEIKRAFKSLRDKGTQRTLSSEANVSSG